jgi:hypothetical protein
LNALRFLLITAADSSEGSQENLAALAASVERQGIAADHVIVLRGGGPCALPGSETVTVHALAAPLDTALSTARNIALEHARREGLLARADVVGFPDDDCAYPDGLLPSVSRMISEGDALVAIPYAPSLESVDRRRFPARGRRLSPAGIMRSVSSGGIFLAGSAVRAIGNFDERFGLGAPFGASEDTDYALRILAAGMRGRYRGDGQVVQHPYKASRPSQYYIGNVAVLAKHSRRGGTAVLLLRRLAYGALLAARGTIRPAEYLAALKAAAELLGPAPTRRSARSRRTSAPEW